MIIWLHRRFRTVGEAYVVQLVQQPERSVRYLMAMALLWLIFAADQVFQLIGRQPDHPLFSDALSYLAVLLLFLAIWLAITYLRRALRTYRNVLHPVKILDEELRDDPVDRRDNRHQHQADAKVVLSAPHCLCEVPWRHSWREAHVTARRLRRRPYGQGVRGEPEAVSAVWVIFELVTCDSFAQHLTR